MNDEIMKGYDGLTVEESRDHQLKHWLAGNPTCNPVLDVCCPDFSCCYPELLLDVNTRKKFADAFKNQDGKTIGEILIMCLGRVMRVRGLVREMPAADDVDDTRVADIAGRMRMPAADDVDDASDGEKLTLETISYDVDVDDASDGEEH